MDDIHVTFITSYPYEFSHSLRYVYHAIRQIQNEFKSRYDRLPTDAELREILERGLRDIYHMHS